MCGVIGLVSERHRDDLGVVTAELLKTLEYRGYDSTGAAVQGDSDTVVLRKGVGAPSLMVEKLGIVGLAGSLMCGQVRWATFGSVDDVNAQPHEVNCHTHIYGAHNGNVTNCDDLETWLESEGHEVLSNNDGEMLVHTVEHFFARELEARDAGRDPAKRRDAMRAAIIEASARLRGSYAAVIVDPVSRTEWAIKQGSSLYFGFGRDETGGAFALASSDLSSVLKLTRILVPMTEGEFMEYTAESRQLYALAGRNGVEPGEPLERKPVRSRLQAKDAALVPPYESFMEQEIAAQEETCRRIAALFRGGSDAALALAPHLDTLSAREQETIDDGIARLLAEYGDEGLQARYRELLSLDVWQDAVARVPQPLRHRLAGESLTELKESLVSLDSGVLADLADAARDRDEVFSVRLLDIILEREEIAEFTHASKAFIDACKRTVKRGGRIFFVCCGSSYHAALSGAVFFNELAHTEIVPILPGEFRGRFASSLRADDLVVAVSQSGETKDLIDVMNLVIETGLPIRRVGIVNNVSSTLGQEKCDTVLPLRCGPEIAVPATKSYMNQLAIFYGLALQLGEARLASMKLGRQTHDALAAELNERSEGFGALPELVRAALTRTAAEVESAASLLYLRPSMHILATRLLGVAKEGALKIREVVLNHTEGFEASEFKHGPNTILGVNTLFGIEEVLRFAHAVSLRDRNSDGRSAAAHPDAALLKLLYEDYPLVFVTGPDATDVHLTVSQVNTHKIRGATCVMIAEEDAALRQAVTKAPGANPDYRSVYIALPRTGDNLMVLFTATVVLQRLALRMSLLKQQYLDRIGLADHGVHPDVPKNVSKSITVD